MRPEYVVYESRSVYCLGLCMDLCMNDLAVSFSGIPIKFPSDEGIPSVKWNVLIRRILTTWRESLRSTNQRTGSAFLQVPTLIMKSKSGHLGETDIFFR